MADEDTALFGRGHFGVLVFGRGTVTVPPVPRMATLSVEKRIVTLEAIAREVSMGITARDVTLEAT